MWSTYFVALPYPGIQDMYRSAVVKRVELQKRCVVFAVEDNLPNKRLLETAVLTFLDTKLNSRLLIGAKHLNADQQAWRCGRSNRGRPAHCNKSLLAGIGAPPPQRVERRQRVAVAGSGVEGGPE